MSGSEAIAVFGTATALGLIHGAEPGHGWPIAATYALDRDRKWLHGFAASVLLGLGHLVSSLAVVGAFFLTKSYFELARLNEPVVVEGVQLGGPLGLVAGLLLILLGVREYRKHAHGNDDDHRHDDATASHDILDHAGHTHHDASNHDHSHDGDADRSMVARIRGPIPLVGDAGHRHPTPDDLDRTDLLGLVWTAFVLGFVHEEEFEIIGLCLGSSHCLALMIVYALTVLLALVGLTLMLVGGYYRYEERVESLAGYFPAISATVLFGMGFAFILGFV